MINIKLLLNTDKIENIDKLDLNDIQNKRIYYWEINNYFNEWITKKYNILYYHNKKYLFNNIKNEFIIMYNYIYDLYPFINKPYYIQFIIWPLKHETVLYWYIYTYKHKLIISEQCYNRFDYRFNLCNNIINEIIKYINSLLFLFDLT